MARKPHTHEAEAKVEAPATEAVDTPQVVVTEQAPVVEERKLSAQTLAEMEEGRRTLAERAKNP